MLRKPQAIVMIIATLMASSQAAWAASQAVEYLAKQQVQIGCNGTSGMFSQIWETDINGDGKPDLILDHANITCDNGETSANCGASGACEILVYVRKGNLLKPATELRNILGVAYSVDKLPGARLKFVVGRAASQTKIVRWNGRRFQ
jgi:hypothetical protein